MNVEFQTVLYDSTSFLENALPGIPKGPAIYKIFDTREHLVVLNKTSNLSQRLERFFGLHSERVKDLDLRKIAGRIEYSRTFSPFEAAYLLYLERRRHFPKTYRKMKTFRYFTLMKINWRQRFPRVYASRQIKSGVDYFGPFVSRAQFTRMKTAIERTFKLRPCLFNIRGSDPHPDCIYFQMHTCSRPCNNDIDRAGYLADVVRAAAFIQGHDGEIHQPWLDEMTQLADDMKFEEAEEIRKKDDRLRRARHDVKDMFSNIHAFHYIVALPSESSSRRKIAIVRSGAIAAFRDHDVAELRETLAAELRECFGEIHQPVNREWQYDEFCLVSTFMLKSLQSVQLIPYQGIEETVAAVEKHEREKKNPDLTVL